MSAGPCSRPELVVDLEAVGANTRLFAGLSAARVMAVVKADGFGFGALGAARAALAHGATALGVTSVDEALELRAGGVLAPVLSWLNPPDADVAAALTAGVELAVPSAEHLGGVLRAGAATGRRPAVHLHVDCGMARDGCEPAAWPDLCRAAATAQAAGRLEVVGLMGHLGCADRPDDPCTTVGMRRFDRAVGEARAAGLAPRFVHLAATAAALTLPAARHDVLRIGAGLAGIDPSGTTRLRGGLTLRAPLVAVRRVAAGDAVGYGHTWRAPRATRLGLVGLGYADGLPRLASGRAEVLVSGVRRPLVGRISMDQSVVDLGDLPVGPGGTVTVFGPGDDGEPNVADWAAWAETIPHEIVTGIGPRVRRVAPRASLRWVS
ncbi:MAG: alanine racemase [Nocardioidaceae bacterium]